MGPHESEALLSGLSRLSEQGFATGAALATLLRTRGPVFRRPGARMLVFADGTIVRGLSAGCPEADIVERSREAIAAGSARLLRYDREHGYDALLELGCGGEMEVLVEPLRSAADLRFADAVRECLASRTTGRLITAFAANGHCLARPRRLVVGQDVLLDELGAPGIAERFGAMPSNDGVASPANGSIAMAGARVETIETADGTMDALVETLLPPIALSIIGMHDTAFALARVARGMGWQVALVDHREAPASIDLPGVSCVHATPQRIPPSLPLDPRTAVVVMTHNLERDLEWLRALEGRSLAYVGALGSRSRVAKMRASLGFAAQALHAPAGLDLGSETPEEIALAIAAEILAVVNRRAGDCLAHGDGPLH